MGRLKQKDTLRPWLRQWARWRNGSDKTGFSESTTVWRAAHAPIQPEPASSIPKGAVPFWQIQEIDHAMKRLGEINAYTAKIEIVKGFYRHGPEWVMREFGLRQRMVYVHREDGENIIRGYLVAVQRQEETAA